MADAKDTKNEAQASPAKDKATPEDVKKATSDAAKKADDANSASAKANEKAKEAAAPSKAPAGKSASGRKAADAKNESESATPETEENREANAAPEVGGVKPEFLMDERSNRRPGPEENPDNKAFPEEADGAHQAPLEKTKAEARCQVPPAEPLSLALRNPHARLQEDQQWIINREQARMTSSETPAGDSAAAPEGVESANWVDTPGRAHTLSELDDDSTPGSVGQRLRRAVESARLEERPAHQKGMTSGNAVPGAYTVEEELRLQWPGIELGDADPGKE